MPMVSIAGVYLAGRAQAEQHGGWLGNMAEKDRSALPPDIELLEYTSTPSEILNVSFPDRIRCRSMSSAYSLVGRTTARPTLHSRRHLAYHALQCNQIPDSNLRYRC